VKRFKFSLESLFHLRELQMQQEDEKLAGLLRTQAQLEAALARLQADRTDAGRAIFETHVTDSADLRAFAGYVLGLKGRIAGVQAQLQTTSRQVQEQQRKCMEARRNHRMVEKLRDRHRNEWEKEFEQELERAASDAFLSRYARQLRS
jgi:flagellar export protein FliJ